MTPVVNGISFIVIAKNEEHAIGKCLNSIVGLVCENCEVICVDSVSTDRTLEIMQEYASRHTFFTVLQLDDCRNAAVARNRGKELGSKELLFFVDGDIELSHDFVHAALRELSQSETSVVVGGLDEVLYDDDTMKPIKGPYTRCQYSTRTETMMSWGGTYLAKASAVHATGDYDERLYKNQDLDFAVRLSGNFGVVGLPISMGIHHTGEYKDRPWLFLKNGYVLNLGMIARKHHSTRGFWRYWIQSKRTLVSGGIATGFLLLLFILYVADLASWHPVAIFMSVLFAIESAYCAITKKRFMGSLIKHILWPPSVILGFMIEPYVRGAQRSK